jgi:hypothetical protein
MHVDSNKNIVIGSEKDPFGRALVDGLNVFMSSRNRHHGRQEFSIIRDIYVHVGQTVIQSEATFRQEDPEQDHIGHLGESALARAVIYASSLNVDIQFEPSFFPGLQMIAEIERAKFEPLLKERNFLDFADASKLTDEYGMEVNGQAFDMLDAEITTARQADELFHLIDDIYSND